MYLWNTDPCNGIQTDGEKGTTHPPQPFPQSSTPSTQTTRLPPFSHPGPAVAVAVVVTVAHEDDDGHGGGAKVGQGWQSGKHLRLSADWHLSGTQAILE